MVLSPVTGNDELTSQAQAKLMLSSVAIAIKNTGWLVMCYIIMVLTLPFIVICRYLFSYERDGGSYTKDGVRLAVCSVYMKWHT